MRPLPSYNARPVKRREVRRAALKPGGIADPTPISVGMKSMRGGLRVKPLPGRGKPRLKVLLQEGC
jgi:hypothetical protein